MKIIYVESNDDRFWNNRLELATAAVAAGNEVHLVAPAGDRVEQISSEGIIFHGCDELKTATMGMFNNSAVIKSLANLYESIGPDVVHHFDLMPSFYGTQAACKLSLPRIVNSIGSYAELTLNNSFIDNLKVRSLYKRCREFFNKGCCTMIVQNRKQFDFWTKKVGINLDRLTIIKGGIVDTDKFKLTPDPGGVCKFIFVGRILWNKGVGDLIEAAKSLKSQNMKFEVDIYGPLALNDPYGVPEKVVNDWNDVGIINWHKNIADMPAVYESSNVLVLPTHQESMAKSLLEAASCGRAIITTDVAGCRDVVANKVNGILVPVRNQGALASAMAHMIKSPEIRAAYGRAGREWISKEFSTDVFIQRNFELYLMDTKTGT